MTTTNDIPKLFTLTSDFLTAVGSSQLMQDPVLQRQMDAALHNQGGPQLFKNILTSIFDVMVKGVTGKVTDADYTNAINLIDQFAGVSFTVVPDTQTAALLPVAMKDATMAQDFDTIGAKNIAHLCRMP